jgi:CheY-like chemotaxis protein
VWSALLKEYLSHATLPSVTKGVLTVNTHRQKRVFIAGDTYRWRDKIKTALPSDGIVTNFGTDSIDAFTASIEDDKQPDLYILANKMPDSDDGLRFLRNFRKDGCDIPVIICSIHVTDEASEEISRLSGIHINWNPEDSTDEITDTIRQLLAA